jgi:hypothetical protein
MNDRNPEPPMKPVMSPGFNTFETWKEYQAVAMHFNDLLMRLRSRSRSQSLAAVAAFSAVAGVVIKTGIDPESRWSTLALVFLLLTLFWTAIWILDFCYYNRLLVGAVDALIELEKESAQSDLIGKLNLSTRIKDFVVEGRKPATGRLGRERAPWFFYGIVFATLLGGLIWSVYAAGALEHVASLLQTTDSWVTSGPLPLKGPESAISYNDEAMFGADIQLPNIEEFAVKSKFIPPAVGDSTGTRIMGYVAEVRIASLDKKNVPQRYLQKSVTQTKSGPITTEPLEQVTYAAQFTLDLIDQDGFKLGEVLGTRQWIESGKTNVLQELTDKPLELYLVRRVKKVKPHMLVIRCESCRPS